MNPEQASAVAAAMAGLWQSEIPATVRVISAVRDDNRDYRPDPRSRSSWQLATHIATADAWFLSSIERGVFEFDPEAAKQAEAKFTRISDVTAFYETTIPALLQRVQQLPAEQLAAPLDFFGMMSMPRAVWIGFAGNHSVHHRGQLSTHLRALGGRVPDIYGASGDTEAEQPAQA